MINLTVTAYNDRPVANLSASFDELGGTIGRSKTNQLVLPDPDRVVSRVHAKIVYRGGSYCLLACGGNPLMHNDAMVNPGNEVRLSAGDRILIEGYSIAVAPAEVRQEADPFAALFGREEEGTGDSMPPPPSAGRPRSSPGVIGSAGPLGPAQAKSGIPEDWDPFERNTGSHDSRRVAGAQGGQGAPLIRDLPGPAAEDSIDSLFGLQKQSSDELARALGPPSAQPNTASHSDPLRSLNAPPKLDPMPVPDHVPDLNAPWVNKTVKNEFAKTIPIPKGAVLSWAADPADARIPAQPQKDKPAPNLGAPAVPARTPEAGPRSPARAEVAAGKPGAIQPRQESAAASGDELVKGLIDGLAMPRLQIERLTPELMKELGQLLREATKGTVELLAIRAALKREIRADVTIINASENNPLKFSPDVDGAMQHMFGQKVRGFMSPAESMRDAYQDLRAHELGIMAGMKAALAGVLLRFDPHVLEGKLTKSSPLSNLIPAARKAKLWNLFEVLYKQLADEAEADFNTVFGKAFLKAYEGYLEQLDKANGNE